MAVAFRWPIRRLSRTLALDPRPTDAHCSPPFRPGCSGCPGGVVLTDKNRRLHVITWGCQMNVYDSARMADVLAPLGYAPADAPADADMVILNTCNIRDKATEKVFSELGRLRAIKTERQADGRSTI